MLVAGARRPLSGLLSEGCCPSAWPGMQTPGRVRSPTSSSSCSSRRSSPSVYDARPADWLDSGPRCHTAYGRTTRKVTFAEQMNLCGLYAIRIKLIVFRFSIGSRRAVIFPELVSLLPNYFRSLTKIIC